MARELRSRLEVVVTEIARVILNPAFVESWTARVVICVHPPMSRDLPWGDVFFDERYVSECRSLFTGIQDRRGHLKNRTDR